MPTLVISSVDVLIFARERGHILYLLLHTSPSAKSNGHWCLLNGMVKAGETAVHTVVRAVRETVGKDPVNLWALDYSTSTYDQTADQLIIAPVFAAEALSSKVIRSSTFDEDRWIPYEQANGLLRLSGQREAIRRVHDDIAASSDCGAPYRISLHD